MAYYSYDDSLYGTGLPGDPLLGEAGGFATTQGTAIPGQTLDIPGPAAPKSGYGREDTDYNPEDKVTHTNDLTGPNGTLLGGGPLSSHIPGGKGFVPPPPQYDPYTLGIAGLIQQGDAGFEARRNYTQPFTDALGQNYNQGVTNRNQIIGQQVGNLNAFAKNSSDLYGGWAAANQGFDAAGNQSVQNLNDRFRTSEAMDAQNVGQLGSSLGRANSLDEANIGELGSSLGQANAMDAANVGELRGLNAQMRQLQARGYGANVVSDPNDIARQESAYGTFGDFANGSYDYTSQAAQAYADPEALAAQKEVMGTLREQMDPRLTDQERYLYMQSRLAQEQSNRGNRDANLRELERSGMSGSTMALSNLNASSQENANTRALQDLGANAKAIDRASAATRDYGNMANVVSDQSFKQAYGRGQAADTASQFNTNTRLQGAVAQGNMANEIRSANDALNMFNKDQQMTQQRFQDQYAADQQQQAWQRGTDISDAGFRQSENISRNAAIKSDAGFKQTENLSRNAGMLSDAGFRQTGNLNQNAATQSDAELRNIGQQRQGVSDVTQFGGRIQSDWLTGANQISGNQMQAERDNTNALGLAGDAAFRQAGLHEANDIRRSGLVEKALNSQAEDRRAAEARAAAEAEAKRARDDANKPKGPKDILEFKGVF